MGRTRRKREYSGEVDLYKTMFGNSLGIQIIYRGGHISFLFKFLESGWPGWVVGGNPSPETGRVKRTFCCGAFIN